jgi:hypothetical protein
MQLSSAIVHLGVYFTGSNQLVINVPKLVTTYSGLFLDVSSIAAGGGTLCFNAQNSNGLGTVQISGLAINGPGSGSSTQGLCIGSFSEVLLTAAPGNYIRNCGIGVKLGAFSNTVGGFGFGGRCTLNFGSALVVDSCGVGVAMADRSSFDTVAALTISNCTTGVHLSPLLYDGFNHVTLHSSIPAVFTGNTADFILDGSTALSLTALRALTPKVAVDLTRFNRVSES